MTDTDTIQNRKLRILGLSSTSVWGMGEGKGHQSVYRILHGFVEAGHEVHYAWPREIWRATEGVTNTDFEMDVFKDRSVNYAFYQGIHLHRFSIKNLIEQTTRQAKLRFKMFGLLADYTYFLSAVIGAIYFGLKIASEIKPDVIYGHNEEGAFAAYFVAKKLRIPNVTRIYGTRLFPLLDNKIKLLREFKRVIGHILPCAYMIMTDDGTFGDIVLDRLSVPKERIRFWKNGVDDTYDPNLDIMEIKKSIGLREKQPIILSASRLEGWKGVDRLVKAAPEVIAQHPNAVFLILGDGSDRSRLEMLCNQLGVEKHFVFWGQVRQAEVAGFMQCADILCLLSDLTSANNPVLEGMMNNCCIIVLDKGNVLGLIEDGISGRILSPNNLYTLPQLINSLLSDPEKRQMMGRAARNFATQNFYTWKQRAQMEIDLIEQLVGKSRNKEV